jgi:hypothetical protein
VDVRIGVIQSPREVEVDVADDVDRDQLLSEVEKLLEKGDGVLWFTDRRGKRVGVPVPKVTYVEVGMNSGARRVGFGAA